MIYVISVSGYEEYIPIYFECDCSKEEFEKEVSIAMALVVDKILLSHKDEVYDGFISGHEILELMIPMLSKKFRLIKIDHEINLRGESFYTKKNRPDVIDDRTWNLILEHNKKLCGEGSSFFE